MGWRGGGGGGGAKIHKDIKMKKFSIIQQQYVKMTPSG